MPAFRAVLFDFDGTLAPSLPLWVKAYQLALGEFNHLLTEEETVQRCFFRDWHDIAADFGTFSGEEIEIRVNEQLLHTFKEAQLFPEVQPLIDECRAHLMQTALVTSAPRHLIENVFDRLDLHAHFDAIICADDVTHFKPHAEPVLKALSALQRSPAEAIMVGDSHVDVKAGKAAGTATALYLPDEHEAFHDVGRLRATEPDFIFHRHSELTQILGL